MRPVWAATVLAIACAPASAQMAEIERYMLLEGLASMIAYEEACGYAIDPARLEEFLAARGLDTPEAFAQISGSAQTSRRFGEPPGAAICAAARATGRANNLLK